MNRVQLIDVDSKIPNLALMKISAYHKSIGDEVAFKISDPDIVYASIVFSKNKWKGDGIKTMYPDAQVFVGGSGYDLKSKLPDQIEHILPDYDLYGLDYSMGFTTRGCIRNCEFCIVPEKEGKIQSNCMIDEFWDHRHKHLVLLDNNILAKPDHFKKVAEQIIDNNLSVDFNQGLDIRLINKKNAEILKRLRVKPDYRFAWDNVSDEDKIKKGVDTLRDAGINHCLFYVLVGFNTTKEEDLYRLHRLKDWDQRPYVMRYRKNRFYNDLAAWGNQQRFFMTMSFDRFCEYRHKRSLVHAV